MKLLTTIAIVMAGLQFSTPVLAHGKDCSTRMLAGRWLFATGIGHQQLGGDAPPPADITAIGTMNISRNGTLEGKFDVTFEGAAFAPGLLYSGSVQLGSDCTGTLSFVTSRGTPRTDSIVLADRDEIWAMSQDPNNLWTYRVRRISSK